MKSLLVATVLTAATAATAQNATFVQCLQAALSNDTNTWTLPDDPMFLQGDVHPYNLNYNTVPAAITFPKSQEQVSGIVKCAHAADIAVQARSGGHSYANYGKAESRRRIYERELANTHVACSTRRVQRLIGGGYEEHGFFHLQRE
jgi:hypothetical protein